MCFFVHTRFLDVGLAPNGNEIRIPVLEFISHDPGRTVYIQAGMHGGEVTIWVLDQIASLLKKSMISGKVVMVPIANPISWYQRIYFSVNGKFDFYMGKDWNRNFPGSKNGSLGDRICSLLYGEALNANLAIDLHTSRRSFPFAIVGCKSDLTLAKIAGIEYTLLMDLEDQIRFIQYKTSFLGQLVLQSIPHITFECGSHDSYELEHIRIVTDAVIRLLQYEKIVSSSDYTPSSTLQQVKFYTQSKTYKSPKGGFIIFDKQVGEHFKLGDLLFHVIDPLLLQDSFGVMAEEDGIVQKISPTHIYFPGDEVMEVIPHSFVSFY